VGENFGCEGWGNAFMKTNSTAEQIRNIQVNIPFDMLYKGYLDRFLKYRLNPEIGLDAHSLDTYSLADFETIASRLLGNNLTVTLHAPFMDLAPGSPDSAVRALTRQRFRQMLRLVSVFRPKTIVCHSGYDNKRYGHMWEEWLQNSLEIWEWLAADIRCAGAVLMIENVYEEGPAEMRVLFERLQNQGVRFCLDIGHQHAFSRSTLQDWLQALGPYLGQLHLHDNDGNQDSHLALGKGTSDLTTLFRFLKADRVGPLVVTLEPHQETDLWPSLEYLKKVWG